jgi:hypothetical protein
MTHTTETHATHTAIEVWDKNWQEQERRAAHPKQLQSNPQQFGRVPAPPSAPGPRKGAMNALVPSAPQEDWEIRETWENPDPRYIRWVKMEWEQLVEGRQLKSERLSAKNGLKPLRQGLPQLQSVKDYMIRKKLADIQRALKDECTFYETWPERCRHLFVGNFQEVQDFIEVHKPTWPMVVELVMQILWQTGADPDWKPISAAETRPMQRTVIQPTRSRPFSSFSKKEKKKGVVIWFCVTPAPSHASFTHLVLTLF